MTTPELDEARQKAAERLRTFQAYASDGLFTACGLAYHRCFTSDEARRKLAEDLAAVLVANSDLNTALTAERARADAAEKERDEARDDRDDFRDRLHDLVMIDAEAWAIGGGPGFKERHDKAWSRAREPFEP